MSEQLRRLVVEFKPEGHELRVLYRTKDGPRPGTVRRRREASELARDGLRAALEALEEGPVEERGRGRIRGSRGRSKRGSERGSMTDRRDEARERREADDNRHEERERRSDELKESWRRNHPSEEDAERDRPRRGRGSQA